MGKMHLVMASASQIQSYIFASNRLREHVGASYLVAQATGEWALRAVQAAAQVNNLVGDASRLAIADGEFAIENHAAENAAEVIYSGGGNVEVLFTQAETAKKFVRQLSERLLCEAPGLRVAFGIAEFEWAADLISVAEKHARDALDADKRARVGAGGALLGLGVTAACTATGLPASAWDEGKPISAESAARLAAFNNADRVLRRTFERELGDFRFPYDLDKLGRSLGEDSHIAVLHADGNGFGVLRQKMLAGFTGNRDYVQRARNFSNAVRDIARDALAHTLQALCARVTSDGKSGARGITHLVEGRTIGIELKPAGGGSDYLPVRPIIYGGDDLTLVCDGRIALSLAEEYLLHFEAESASSLRKYGLAEPAQLTACAGVAIVRAHFPFVRAYELSEELCGEAKKRRAEVKKHIGANEPGSYLDWHIAMSGLIGDLDDIRARDYVIPKEGSMAEGSMTLRPVAVSGESGARTWKTVEAGTRAFQKEWAGKRNKVKALREALRRGPKEVERFSRNYVTAGGKSIEVLPKLPGVDARATGWVGEIDRRCAYADAVELMDMYIPITISKFVTEAEERA